MAKYKQVTLTLDGKMVKALQDKGFNISKLVRIYLKKRLEDEEKLQK